MRFVVALSIASTVLAAGAIADTLSTSATVALLIEATLAEKSEQDAFHYLEALGVPGVPYLVGHLSDVRPLPVQRMSLANNFPGAFESLRHYSPQTVHDALAAILNQVTGVAFEPVYNGATAEVRAKNTKQWRAWCRVKFPKQSKACNGAI